MQGAPGNFNWGGQDMQAVGKPDIYIDGEATAAYLADCRLTQRQRMLDQGFIEPLIERHSLLPEVQLAAIFALDRENRVSHEGAVRHQRGGGGTTEEGQP